MIQNAAVLFIDAVGSVEISRVLGPTRYNCEFLNPLQQCFRELLFLHGFATKDNKTSKTSLNPHDDRLPDNAEKYWSIRGDELCVVVPCPNPPDEKKMLQILVRLGLETKLIWWQRDPNLKRLREGADVFELGLGIHFGPVAIESRTWLSGNCSSEDTYEGIAFNYAKRIEAVSRQGEQSKLMVSEDAWRALGGAHSESIFFSPPRKETPKGMDPTLIYEIIAYKPPEAILTEPCVDELKSILMKRPYDLTASVALMDYFKSKKRDLDSQELHSSTEEYIGAHAGLRDWLNKRP